MKALQNDRALLDKMMADIEGQDGLNRPGAFWLGAMTETAKALRRFGLEDFRSSRRSTPGSTWTDAPYLSVFDYTYKFPRTLKGRLTEFVFRSWPVTKALEIADRTVRTGAQGTYFEYYKIYREHWVNAICGPWVEEALKRHRIPDVTIGDPIDRFTCRGCVLTPAYLGTLARVMNFSEHMNLAAATSLLVIGGGYGYEVHLLAALFPNLRKIITLDVPPNLYVQTQYLKAAMDGEVWDYAKTAGRKTLEFMSGSELEVMAIAPWQLERVEATVDLLWNSCSFQEMDPAQVQRYARAAKKLMAGSQDPHVCLTMYNWEETTTIAGVLEAFDGWAFQKIPSPRKFWPARNYEEHHYIGSGERNPPRRPSPP